MLTLDDRGAVAEVDNGFEEGEVVTFPAELVAVLETKVAELVALLEIKVLVKVVGWPFAPLVVSVVSIAPGGSEEMVGFDCDSVWNNVTL